MKTMIKNKALYIVSSILLLTGCTNDLDILPKDSNTFLVEDFYSTPESYKQGLAGVYGNLTFTATTGTDDSNIVGVDEGLTQYTRSYWNIQELTTDEAKWQWENDGGLRALNRNTWGSDNETLRGFFGRCMVQVAFVNEYLRQTSDAILDSRDVDESLREDIKTYRAEAIFLRALAYYHMMDLFGKAGYVTENDPVGAYQSPQYERPELFTLIESELLAILPDLKAPLQNEYARVDKGAAWMLLAKIYLNAEVYIGQDKYTECITYCEKIIGGGFKISPVYANNFNADNHENSARDEIIFPIISDGVLSQNYGASTTLVNAQVGAIELNAADFGISSGWPGGLRVTKQFSETMLNGNYDTDDRNTIISEDRPIEMTSITNGSTGYIVAKWSNKTSTGENGSATEIVDTDFPMFRLGDVYLMYAESVVRGGGGSLPLAKDYINELRGRANNPNTITTNDLNLDFILNERLVELYWEGHRRQDLIRFGKYTGGTYNWSWKGNAITGIAISENRKVFPIPGASLAANSNLTQNEGY